MSRPRAALITGAAVLMVVGSAALWRRQHPKEAPAAPAATALHPTEARLLAAAAREPANPRPFLELAEEYAASARPASALWAYSEAEARSPSGSIRLKLADTLRQMEYPQTAASLLRAVIAGRGPATAQARPDLADLLLSTGQPTAALSVLRGAGPEAEMLRGRAHEAAGDVAAAAQSYRRAAAGGNPEGCERLARLELAAGQTGAAREAVCSLDAAHPGRPESLMLTAAIHAAASTPQELDAAIAALLRCVRLRPRDAEVYYQAGLVFLRKGDRGAARDQLERAVTLDANHAAARGRFADLLAAMGQTARAHRERAAYFALKDQPDRSLAELRRAGAAGYPDDVERTLMAARTAGELQQIPDAVREDQAGLKRHPGNPELMLQLGLTYELSGSRDVLERLCREWMALQPASGRPYWLLGRRALDDAREQEAISLFEKACALEPDNDGFCESLGGAYLLNPAPANVTKARAWLEKAVSLSARSSGAHRQLAAVLERVGDPAAARLQYLESLDVVPAQTAVLNSLVQLSTRLQRPTAARLFTELAQEQEEQMRERLRLTRQVRDHPGDAAARIELARFLIRRGQLDAARNQLERAAESGSAAQPARRMLTEVDRCLRVHSG